MSRTALFSASGAIALLGFLAVGGPASAQSVMQQCGQQYQAAKAANTLNGMTWNQYRTDCAARLKATPAAASAPAAAPEPATAAAPASPLKPAPTVATTPAVPAAPAPTPTSAAATAKPMSAGRAAFVVRERQCGSEWKAKKATLVAATPGLTWPKYLSQCNTRLKAAGQ